MLFVDEAYQLNAARGGSFMSEAVDEIVGCLTHPDFQHRMVVVLAGYSQDMAQILDTNQGLASRFTESVSFPDFDAPAVRDLALLLLKKDDPTLKGIGQDRDELLALARQLVKTSKFSNGRDVVTWVDKARRVMARSLETGKKARQAVVTLQHLRTALSEHTNDRKLTAASYVDQDSVASMPVAEMTATATPVATRARVRNRVDAAVTEDEQESPAGEASPMALTENLFGAVDAKTIASLQAYMDEHGLASKDGVARLRADPDLIKQVKLKLVQDHGHSEREAAAQLEAWSSAQDDLEEQLKQLEEQKQSKTLLQIPIWACQVCGRANNPTLLATWPLRS